MIQRVLVIYISCATLMMQVEAPNLHNQSKTHTLVDCLRQLMANKYNDDGPMRFCLPNDDNEYLLVNQTARLVDSGDCPYINKLQGNFDTRKCNPGLGICPNNSYLLSNDMYSVYNACFPSLSTTTATATTTATTTTATTTATTVAATTMATTTTGNDNKSKDSNSGLHIGSLFIGIGIGIGIVVCIVIVKKCCKGFCKEKTKGKTTSEEEIPMIERQGSALGAVNRRVEDGRGRDLAETHPADQNNSVQYGKEEEKVVSVVEQEQEPIKIHISQYSTTF